MSLPLSFSAPVLLSMGNFRPLDYARVVHQNGGSAYSKPVVLILVPAFGNESAAEEWINSFRDNENRPQTFDFAFARIAQDQQIWLAIESHKPTVIVTTGDHWLNHIMQTCCRGLPPYKVADVCGVMIPVCLSPAGRVALVYPMPDLHFLRKKRLSGGSPRGLSPSPSPSSSPPNVGLSSCIEAFTTESDETCAKLFDALRRLYESATTSVVLRRQNSFPPG